MVRTSTLILILTIFLVGIFPNSVLGNQKNDSHSGIMNSDTLYSNTSGQAVFVEFISDIKLYPNPVKTQLKISFQSKENKSAVLRIRDLLGKVIKEKKSDLVRGYNNMEFAVDQLNPGVYFIEINVSGEKKVVKRFIKKD